MMYKPYKHNKLTILPNNEVCIECLNEPEGTCILHTPKPPDLETCVAIACEELVQMGVAKRLDNHTIKIL